MADQFSRACFTRVWIAAMRDIKAGEELTYDYYLYDGEGDAPCTCGTPNCRGTMYSRKEMRKRQRAAASLKKAPRKQSTRRST